MKIVEGLYTKTDKTSRDIKVFVLEENNTHIKGIDLSLLNEQDTQEFNSALNILNDVITKTIKTSFRNFKKDQLTIKK